ncbi:deoxynucleoside kinase, partial [Staphylococcus aureus]
MKERIKTRNRDFEVHIEDDYLLKLKADYLAYYKSLKANGHHVLRIDTTNLDFVNHPKDYDTILKQINELIGGQT